MGIPITWWYRWYHDVHGSFESSLASSKGQRLGGASMYIRIRIVVVAVTLCFFLLLLSVCLSSWMEISHTVKEYINSCDVIKYTFIYK